MTLVVCPNLAVDRVLVTPTLSLGELTRCRALSQQAGGKGANVARALRTMRGAASVEPDVLVGFSAGLTGRMFRDLATGEGLAVSLVLCRGETRISTVLLTDDGATTRLFEYGPVITESDEEALHEAVRSRRAHSNEWAIVDGAVPPGAGDGFYAAICRELRASGYRVLIDATGTQLVEGLRAEPDVAKVNYAEAVSAVGSAVGVEVNEEPAPPTLALAGAELCAGLIEAGARDAIVTLGEDGAVGICDGRRLRVRSPSVESMNAVGSGDCFAAAYMVALESGESTENALALATGVAAANAASPLTGHFDLGLAHDLAEKTIVEIL